MRIFEGYQKGVNLGGWISQCENYTKKHYDEFITEADIERIAGFGLDHVRVPVDYMVIEEEDGTRKEEGFAYIDSCISWCRKYGLNMVLDLHKTFGYSFDPLDDTDKEVFFYRKDLQDRFIRLWENIAQKYGKYSDMLAFELLNEIREPGVADAWNEIAVRTIKAIRVYAPDTYIIFGGVLFNSVTSVPGLADPVDDRVVYNFHCYEPIAFTHQAAYWIENMPDNFVMQYPESVEDYREASRIFHGMAGAVYNPLLDGKSISEIFETLFRPAVEKAAEKNVPLYCGEYGVIDRAPLPDTLRWLTDIHGVLVKYGIGRALWNYKGKDFGLIDEHYKPIMKDMVKLL